MGINDSRDGDGDVVMMVIFAPLPLLGILSKQPVTISLDNIVRPFLS